MVDTKICATSYKLRSFELGFIVYHDSSRHAESIYDALHELDCYFLRYIHHWHNFYPLGEHVDCDE
jgi:hypothetical protein